jgi:hypothetical protein
MCIRETTTPGQLQIKVLTKDEAGCIAVIGSGRRTKGDAAAAHEYSRSVRYRA